VASAKHQFAASRRDFDAADAVGPGRVETGCGRNRGEDRERVRSIAGLNADLTVMAAAGTRRTI